MRAEGLGKLRPAHRGPEELNGGYFGRALHTASQLAAAAHAGQVLVSGVTTALLERDDLRDLGMHRLEGAMGEHDLWQLDDGDHPSLAIASVRRGNLPGRSPRLVGREPKLDAVAEAMEASPVGLG